MIIDAGLKKAYTGNGSLSTSKHSPRTFCPCFVFLTNMINPVKEPWWQESVSVFTKLSGWVILPLIVGTTLGRWLDGRYGSGQRWFFICIGAAFVFSTYGMIRQAKREYAKLAPLEKLDTTDKVNITEKKPDND